MWDSARWPQIIPATERTGKGQQQHISKPRKPQTSEATAAPEVCGRT